MTELEKLEQELLESGLEAPDLSRWKTLLDKRGKLVRQLAFEAAQLPTLEALTELRGSLAAGERITEKMAVFRQSLTGPLHWLGRYGSMPCTTSPEIPVSVAGKV